MLKVTLKTNDRVKSFLSTIIVYLVALVYALGLESNGNSRQSGTDGVLTAEVPWSEMQGFSSRKSRAGIRQKASLWRPLQMETVMPFMFSPDQAALMTIPEGSGQRAFLQKMVSTAAKHKIKVILCLALAEEVMS